eukprot:980979-Pyramimonas_sp.AAC.1
MSRHAHDWSEELPWDDQHCDCVVQIPLDDRLPRHCCFHFDVFSCDPWAYGSQQDNIISEHQAFDCWDQ